jgi:two-component system, NtrC family, nitrogen regulation response regulator NtrX
MTAAKILVVDDEADIRILVDEILSEEGYRVTTACDAAQARTKIGTDLPDLVLLDIWMPDTDGITLLKEWSGEANPGCPIVMMSGHGTVETAVEATRLGAADFIEKPVSIAKLLLTVEKALQNAPKMPIAENPVQLPPLTAPIGKSEQIFEVRRRLEQSVPLASPILIVGESGSSREAAARYVYALSARREQPFVCLSGDDLPAGRTRDALLGSGISGEGGFIGQAEGGFLFLRELESFDADAQRILAAIVERGDSSSSDGSGRQKTDLRFIASITPQAFADPAGHGLRADLIEQLAISIIRVPALRDYPEDVPELLRVFVEQFVDANQLPFRRFGVAAQNRLRNYPWPGNVRELRALVRRLLIATGGPEEIQLDELESALPPTTGQEGPLLQQDLLSLPLREAREQFEKAYLIQQLALCDGKVGQLAKRVGMERTHLYRKLRALGINFRR